MNKQLKSKLMKNKLLLVLPIVLIVAAIFVVNMQGTTNVINVPIDSMQGSIVSPSDGSTIQTSSVIVRVNIPYESLDEEWGFMYPETWTVTVYNDDGTVKSETHDWMTDGMGGSRTVNAALPASGAYTIRLTVQYYVLDFIEGESWPTNTYYSSFSTTASPEPVITSPSAIVNSPNSITLITIQKDDYLTIPISITVTKGYYRVTDITWQIDSNVEYTNHYYDANGDYTFDAEIRATADTSGQETQHTLHLKLESASPDVFVEHSFSVTWTYIDSSEETTSIDKDVEGEVTFVVNKFTFDSSTKKFTVDATIKYTGTKPLDVAIGLILNPEKAVAGLDSLVIAQSLGHTDFPYHVQATGTYKELRLPDTLLLKEDWDTYPESYYWLAMVSVGDGIKMDAFPVGTASGFDLSAIPGFEFPLVFGVIIAIVIKRRNRDE